MGAYVREGAVRYKEHRWQGLESAFDAFCAMLKGDNFGKTLVVAGPE